MPKKVQPSAELGKQIDTLLTGTLDEAIETSDDILSQLMRLSLRKLIQEALEQEVADYLGRDWGQRHQGAHRGYRNGYEDKHLTTAEGKVDIRAPQVRDAAETYRSRLLDEMPNMSRQLQDLVVEAYVHGLSTRDIEATFTDEDGERLLSKDAVTELSESLWDEYEAFNSRDLSDLDVVYLFVDGVYEALRREADCKEAVLVCWGILADGSKALISLGLGNTEDFSSWRDFFHQMIHRGLRMPLLVISDGAPGLIKAVDEVFHKSRRQRRSLPVFWS